MGDPFDILSEPQSQPELFSKQPTSSRSHSYQSALDSFLPSTSGKGPGGARSDIDELASKIASKVAEQLGHNVTATTTNTTGSPNVVVKANNLIDFLDEQPEFKLSLEENSWILQCSSCAEFLSSPVAFLSSFRRPSGKPTGSLATGLYLFEEVYQQLIAGKCDKWYHQKGAMIKHLSSKTHVNATDHMKSVKEGRSREIVVVKNQLRAAIGIVKTKSAAIQYEERIAELQAAGADVGDFGHSRKLFPEMILAVCHYIDQKTSSFLATPLPNTGMPPHFYVTADKSTNHRTTNQVTVICPVVNGTRQGIILNAREVYTNSDGTGGTGDALAKSIFTDLKNHVGFQKELLLQVQGRVMDGQYLNEPFITAMNEPIMQQLGDDLSCKDAFWWPVQWDPVHWLDKVFSKFKDSRFVDRLLKRVALYHQLFSHGKMHSVARHTAKDLKLPFRVTNAYAHQRFMSSSYLSLKNLADSLEVYIETFKDHDNREEIGYKLCGQDFVHDLLGVLDLLWPLVVLMLHAQANWYPGWKLTSHIPLVKGQMESFVAEVSNVCPRLHQRIEELQEKRYGRSELELGWFVVGGGEDQVPVNWSARELEDCIDDVKKLARDVIDELDERYENSFSDLNKLLSKCFDFASLFTGLCGTRLEDKALVDNRKFSELGAAEFRQCMNYASQLPHVQNKNLELGSELSSTVFWRFKKVLIEIVWGAKFPELFCHFFKKIMASTDGRFTLQDLVMPNGVAVTSFHMNTPPQFCFVHDLQIRVG